MFSRLQKCSINIGGNYDYLSFSVEQFVLELDLFQQGRFFVGRATKTVTFFFQSVR